MTKAPNEMERKMKAKCLVVVVTLVGTLLVIAACAPAPAPVPAPQVIQTPGPIPGAPPPIPAGWSYHAASNFKIALPQRWQKVDVEKEGIEPVLNLLKTQPADLASGETSDISSQNGEQILKLYAMDSQSSGNSHPDLVIAFKTLPSPENIAVVCGRLKVSYPVGKLIESKCGLSISQVDALRFTARGASGAIVTKWYQYIYLKDGNRFWIVNMSADENAWLENEPTFSTMGESFVPEQNINPSLAQPTVTETRLPATVSQAGLNGGACPS